VVSISSLDFTLAVLPFYSGDPRIVRLMLIHRTYLCANSTLTIVYTLLFRNYRRKIYLYLRLQSDVFSLVWLPRDDNVTGQRYSFWKHNIRKMEKKFNEGVVREGRYLESHPTYFFHLNHPRGCFCGVS